MNAATKVYCFLNTRLGNTHRPHITISKELINVVVKTSDNTIRTSGGLFKIEGEYFKDWQLSEFCAYQTAIVEYTKTTD